MAFHAPSAEQYEANRTNTTYTLLPEDDYIVEIKEVQVQKNQVDLYRKDADGNNIVRDTLKVLLRPISFLDGGELVDEHGDPVGDDRLFFGFIDPTHVGLLPVPARARKFFAAALGVAVDDEIDLEDFKDLEGKRLVASVVHNNGKHKVTDYRILRQRKPRPVKPADEDVASVAASKLSDADAAKVSKAAKEIFEDELPF
jgi:hypothetical protein